jgi:prepilin peptidase CpaA
MGGIGGGDVKLMAAIGAWLGMPLTFYVFVVSSLAAGVYALVLVIVGGRLHETWVNLKIIFHRLRVFGRHLVADDQVEMAVMRNDRRDRLIPFAVMMALAVVTVAVWTWAAFLP